MGFLWLFVLIFNIKFTPNCVTVTPGMYIINVGCVRVGSFFVEPKSALCVGG